MNTDPAICCCGHRITQHTTCGCTQNCSCTGFVADLPGLNIDMLDVDRLNNWADNIETYGSDLTHWTRCQWVVAELRRLAKAIDQEVRDVGTLRQSLRTSQPAAPDTTSPPRVLSREAVAKLKLPIFPMRDPDSWHAGWDAAINAVLRLCPADAPAQETTP